MSETTRKRAALLAAVDDVVGHSQDMERALIEQVDDNARLAQYVQEDRDVLLDRLESLLNSYTQGTTRTLAQAQQRANDRLSRVGIDQVPALDVRDTVRKLTPTVIMGGKRKLPLEQ